MEAEKIVKQDPNEPDFRFRVPQYDRSCRGDREISLQFEIQLKTGVAVLSSPLVIHFYFTRQQKRKMCRCVDYREYSTEEEDDSNSENRDTNVGFKRRRNFSKRRQTKQSKRARHHHQGVTGDEGSQCSDGFDLYALVRENNVTMLDVLRMITHLHLPLEVEKDFESILSSMYSFDEDITDLLNWSSISGQHKAKRMATILSDNQMERIIDDLNSGKSKLDELNLPSASSIQDENLPQQEQDELFLIEDTFKSMALDLPLNSELDMDLEITHPLKTASPLLSSTG